MEQSNSVTFALVALMGSQMVHQVLTENSSSFFEPTQTAIDLSMHAVFVVSKFSEVALFVEFLGNLAQSEPHALEIPKEAFKVHVLSGWCCKAGIGGTQD